MKWNYFMLLFLFYPSYGLALVGGNCNVAPSPYLCAASPPAPTPCDMWIGASYSAWYACGAAGACVPDASSTTGFSKTTPTQLKTFQMAGPCGCAFGQCSCGNNLTATGPCTGSCTMECTPCVPTPGVCIGPVPPCGTNGPGLDTCGGPCTIVGPICCVPAPGVCAGPIPACGTTGPGVDTCGGPCVINGPICCIPNGSCSAAPPLCGTATAGVDNCGTACIKNGPACCANPNHYCGTVTAAENPAVPLSEIMLNLRDKTGKIVASIQTNAAGSYKVMPPALGGPFYLNPVLRRNQVVSPNALGPYTIPQANLDFKLRFVTASLTIKGPPGAFALVTLGAYAGHRPPSIGISQNTVAYSSALGPNGEVKLPLPSSAVPYFLTCWSLIQCGDDKVFGRDPGQVVNGGGPFNPQTNIPSLTCGQPVCS